VRDFVFLDDARVFGGGQGNVLRLARFIRESLPESSVQVTCPKASELARRCRAAEIAVADACFPGFGPLAPLRILRAVRRLRRLLAPLGAEAVVVGMSLRTQVYAHAAALGLGRSLHIVHFLPEQDSARRLTAKLLLRRFGALVVVGESAARAYRARLGSVQVVVANTFLLPEEFAEAKRTARPTIDGPPALGVLARLIPEKGILELVSELAEIESAWSSLIIGGQRENERYARAVEARLEGLNFEQRVLLPGHVDDLGAFFADIDALIVPSVGNEGQPTVIVEALAHDKPAIVREPISSADFEGLPVFSYRDACDLERLLGTLDRPMIDSKELLERFGPMQVLEALDAAVAGGKRGR
jgi:glycosyltransferase involved in cell wall biosynthesis